MTTRQDREGGEGRTMKLLTDARIRGLRAPASGRTDISDPSCRGLSLRLTSGGVLTWSYRYRDRLTGRTERKLIGRYPTIGLARAREIADGLRVEVSDGQSPQARHRAAKAAEATAISFGDLADRYQKEVIDAQHKATGEVSASYLSSARVAFSKHKAKDVSRADVVAFLTARALTAPIGANRTLIVLRGLFQWAVEHSIVERNPVDGIKRPIKRERSRDRVLTDPEIVTLWHALDTLDGAVAGALKMILISGQRPGQCASMTRGELVDFADPAKACWHIPVSKRKDVRGSKVGPHLVPLSAFAREIIDGAGKTNPSDSDSFPVFRSTRSGDAVARHALSVALARLIAGLDQTAPGADAAAVASLKLRPARPHDFRRTAATGMEQIGEIDFETRLSVFDHAPAGGVHTTYNRYSRLPERRAALDLWAGKLRACLICPNTGSKVEPRMVESGH
jgi:integrase